MSIGKKNLPSCIDPNEMSIKDFLKAQKATSGLSPAISAADKALYDSALDDLAGPAKIKGAPTSPCHTTHKPMPLGNGLFIRGGSCSSPVKDLDIYVGLDLSMARHTRSYPWNPGEAFLYHISDMQAPADAASFKELITYLEVEIRTGKNVHVGCIGGHGRTGTVFAALVAQMMKEKDAIQYVRKNYCHKAVESKAQIEFLMKHFGVSTAEGTKSHYASTYSTGGWKGTPAPKKAGTLTFAPMSAKFCLWGDKLSFYGQ